MKQRSRSTILFVIEHGKIMRIEEPGQLALSFDEILGKGIFCTIFVRLIIVLIS